MFQNTNEDCMIINHEIHTNHKLQDNEKYENVIKFATNIEIRLYEVI